MGVLEQARSHRPVSLTAEQLLLEALRAHHCRRKDDEGCFGTRAPLVDHPRRDLLADARRTGDENSASSWSDPLESRADGVDRDRAAVKLILVAGLAAQGFIFPPKSLGVGRAVDEVDQPLGLERLLDEVDG